MKNSTFQIIFAVLISALFLTGCATSIPSPDEGNGTLVIIPLNQQIEHNFDLYFDYYIQINEIQTDKIVRYLKIPDNRDYILIRSLKPGDYYISGYKWRTDNDSGKLIKIHRSETAFRVEKGKISMTPYGFGWYKGHNDKGQEISRFNILKNDDGILHNEVLRELISEHPDMMALWNIPEIVETTIPKQIETVLADAPKESFELSFSDALNGQKMTIEDLRGKVVVIDFWATWCGPCVGEIPNMKALYSQYKNKGVEFIGISLDEKSSTLVEFCKKNGVTWPQYCEEGRGWDTKFSQKWGINSIPRLFVLDQQGNLYSTDARGKLETIIPDLLKMY